jgi:hypothetical protein
MSASWLRGDERMRKQLVDRPATVRILDEAAREKVGKVGRPLLRLLERWRWARRNEKERAHRMNVVQRRMHFGELETRDAETPNVDAVVVRHRQASVVNDLGRHPKRRANDRLTTLVERLANSTDTKIGELDGARVGEEHVGRLEVAMDDESAHEDA